MKSEKKLSKKKKIIIGVIGIIIALCLTIYGVTRLAYASFDTITWTGTFVNPTRPWSYLTTSYAHVWCDKTEDAPKLYANKGNGFTRTENNSTNTITLTMDEEKLFNYLNWDLEYGDIVYWQADADVSVRYSLNGKTLKEETYPSIEGNKEDIPHARGKNWSSYENSVVYADTMDLSDIKRIMSVMTPNITFPDWDETGSLFFILSDSTGASYGLSHNFSNNIYAWRELKNNDDMEYKPTANFIIKFVDENGKELKESIANKYKNIPQGQPFTYTAAEEEMEIEDVKYKFKSWSCKGTDRTDNSTVCTEEGTTTNVVIVNGIKKKHYYMDYTITLVYSTDEHKVTINYQTEDGTLIDTKKDVVKDGEDYTHTADKVLTKDNVNYKYLEGKWVMGDKGNGATSSNVITVNNCIDDVVITCIYKKTEDHIVTIDYETEEGIVFDSFSDTAKDEEPYTYVADKSIKSGHYTYTFKKASWEMGEESGKSSTNSIKINKCTDDIYIVCVYEASEKPEEDEGGGGSSCTHEFGPWTTVTSGEDGTCSRTCILCGYELTPVKHKIQSVLLQKSMR